MSIERSGSTQATAAGSKPLGDRLRVITAGRVGDMEAQLGASGFDIVAVAQTEDALIDAVTADEPDAIVVEADLCTSLEPVRDLAPDALLIVIGDHTPAGALGRIEQGVSGTVMAGLLHALVAEGVGAAAVWGLVPAFGPGGGLHVPPRMSGSLLYAKADLIRAYLVNALHDPTDLVTAASTLAVTVSATLLLTLSAARPDERPARVSSPAPVVESAPEHPVFAAPPTTRPTLAYGLSGSEGEPGDRRGPNDGKSNGHGRHGAKGEDQGNDDQGGDQDNDDQGGDQDNDDQGGDQGDDQGENESEADDDQGDNERGEDGGDQDEDGDEQGEDEDETRV